MIRPEDQRKNEGGAGKGGPGKEGAGKGAGNSASGSNANGSGDEEDGHREAGEDTRKRPELSEKLMRDLTAHRTAVLQAALTQNPQVALVTLVHRMAETVFGQYSRGNDVVKVNVHLTSDYSLAQHATGYENSPAGAILGQAETEWGDRLPGNPEAMFAWLLGQDRETLLELLAYCTARSIDAVAGRERSRDQSDAIAEALGIDMADWWTPTPECYLRHVPKAKVIAAVTEACGALAAQPLEKMKKDEAVKAAATQLEGKRWLPSTLRPYATGSAGVDKKFRGDIGAETAEDAQGQGDLGDDGSPD
ncbi:hypothetical protein QTH97_26215 [Variovorax sp. J22R24]|uniref:hypothetical protein n=1 Tax=Variovorax gracilis TaxID=3053502 RepID=UPI002576E55E|nr:hypothetical protein [Variovorax sp. J22R24]MDM0108471.1 hypothetical protein [Variovorax sp. J22R24]